MPRLLAPTSTAEGAHLQLWIASANNRKDAPTTLDGSVVLRTFDGALSCMILRGPVLLILPGGQVLT
jgi:hypothetical protein